MDGLFFAVLPDHDAKARIVALAARLRSERGLLAPPIAPERLHVSLHRLGPYAHASPEIIAAAKQVGAAVAAPPFQVTFDRALSFRGLRRLPLVLAGGDGLTALTAFQRTLAVELEKAGLGRLVKSRFTPHLTLLYDDHLVREMVIDPLTWTVRELTLVQSLYGQGRHIHLAHWPLRTRTGAPGLDRAAAGGRPWRRSPI